MKINYYLEFYGMRNSLIKVIFFKDGSYHTQVLKLYPNLSDNFLLFYHPGTNRSANDHRQGELSTRNWNEVRCRVAHGVFVDADQESKCLQAP